MEQNKSLRHENSTASKLFGIAVIVIINLFFSMNYFANTFPASEGWFVNYVELFTRGKVPYRDFYYYLPPFTLLLDTAFWKLSFGYLLAFRGWYLAERILIYVLIFNLLCKFYSCKTSALSCVFAEILCTADDFDFFGDYNQNALLLTVLIAYAAVAFAKDSALRSKLWHLFAAGLILGLMFLCKQTIFFAAGAGFFLILTALCISKKDKGYWVYCLAVAVGLLIPILAFLAYLLLNGAFAAFIDQVFLSVNGKGGILDILIKSPLKPMKEKSGWALATLLYLVIQLSDSEEKDKKNYQKIIVALSVVIVFMITSFIDLSAYLKAFFLSPKCAAVVVVSAIPVMVVLATRKRWNRFVLVFDISLAIFVTGLLIGATYSQRAYHAIYALNISSLVEASFNFGMFYLLIILFCKRFYYMLKNRDAAQEDIAWIMFAGAALILCYATAMAAGLSIMAANAMRIATPLALCCIFTAGEQKEFGAAGFKLMIAAWCCVLCTVVIATKSVNAYPWWGCYNEPKEYKTYSVEGVPAMTGIRFAKRDKEVYETFTKLITENSDEDDVIFGYPYLKIFNILCDRYNSNFVPVIWYDVVGDKYVELTIGEFQENLPEIIIWMDIPGALQAHEGVYRNGEPLVQRELEHYLQQQIPEKYELLGQLHGYSAYRLKDEWR